MPQKNLSGCWTAAGGMMAFTDPSMSEHWVIVCFIVSCRASWRTKSTWSGRAITQSRSYTTSSSTWKTTFSSARDCTIDQSSSVHTRADNGSYFMNHDPRRPSDNSPVTRVTRDPWSITHDYSVVTVTVWRLRTHRRGKEVSMRFRFHYAYPLYTYWCECSCFISVPSWKFVGIPVPIFDQGIKGSGNLDVWPLTLTFGDLTFKLVQNVAVTYIPAHSGVQLVK